MMDPSISPDKKTIDKVPVPFISSSSVKIQPKEYLSSVAVSAPLMSHTPNIQSGKHMTTAQILNSSPFTEVYLCSF